MLLNAVGIPRLQVGEDVKEAHLERLIQRLVSFFVRQHLCDIPANRDLPRLFVGFIDGIGKKRGKALIDWLDQQLSAKSVSDEMFRDKLEGAVYEENEGVTRFILCALAEAGMTEETRQDLWKFDIKGRSEKRRYLWTIEHIFPQGENIPQSWVDMMADGDLEKAQKLRQRHAHKLGNLTLSVYNSSLGNKSFKEKWDRKDKRGGNYVGYKNGFSLNEDLRDAKGWSVAQIDSRTEKMVDQTMALFPR